MYREHEAFDGPSEPQSKLWRYMDFAKLMDLFESSALFFSRADMLGDPFEGSYSQANIRLRPELYGEGAAELIAQLSLLMREMPRFTAVNCWHMSGHESAAMWETYAARGLAVAVLSTFERLTSSIQCEEHVYVGMVKYIDYTTDFIPESNTFYPFLHKRRSFEHEREVRAIIQGLPLDDGDRFDFEKDSWATGMPIAVSLTTLVEAIYVAPTSPDWLLDLVDRMQRRLGYDFQVRQSDMKQDPVY